MATDEALVEQARAGDADAMDALFERSRNMVEYLSSVYWLPGLDRDDARQELRMALWEAVGCYDGTQGASWRTFMALVLRRRMATALKCWQRKRRMLLTDAGRMDATPAELGIDDDDERTLHDLMPAPVDVEREVLGRLDLERVRELWERLSEMERDVMACLAGGATYAETAAVCGLTWKAVDNARSRVLRKASARGLADTWTPELVSPRWTVEDVERLEQMRREGRTARECARELGRTYQAVRNKLRHLREVAAIRRARSLRATQNAL